MTRKSITLVIISILVLFSSGCWNRRELNELAISVGEGIDRDNEGKYQISTQIVIPGEIASKTSGAASGLPVRIFTATEDTVFEAMRELTTKSPRPIYHSHLRVLVIGESLAKEGIGEVLDMFSRDHEYRSDFYIVIAKDTSAENILSILTSIEKIPANNMVSSLETSEKTWAPTAAITLDKLIQDLVTEGKNPVLTGIEIIGDPAAGQTQKNLEIIKPTAYLKYSGLAVFKSDKMLGWLDQDESKGYNFIMNNVKNTVTDVNCPKEGKFNFEIVKSKTEVTAKVENSTPKIEIHIKSEGNVGEVQCDIDLTKQKTIEELEKSVEEDLINLVEKTINNVKEDFSTDVFGFGDAIHRANAEAWEKLKSDWNDKHFTDLEINVKADIKIRRLGKIGNSITSEIKE
ncbi:Ger(x)C family spore germination protein [Metabacillus litoralis]|uniref:Ger(X)C family spore germination protein n=1 Tax=Metabacillus litoralis TaxID=152268 RepID=A0A5C6W4N2_9BACI|nr:Ger(x)C family spore germination protein [Metabacillus litoralis]TXC92907.1 Ger(x)C family spore germination protein [Metabacillus litoralis]